ncbi:MAG: biotin/lipoyl-binding protein [Hungatella sp.]|nr:biotin/lipoyl-binding protein [Hungatella sp.]
MLIEQLLNIIEICENSELDSFRFKSNEEEVSFHKIQSTEAMCAFKNDYNIIINRKDPIKEISKSDNLVVVNSPHVGIIHLKKSLAEGPEDMVRQGDSLCTIEAMKLYNNVVCPVDGRVVEIMVEDGQEVEYGQPLLKIEVILT